ncbi:MAG: S-methyl-5-thioribose-1-phosphate isomerase [Armatimonadetes bacterium]|nr:S-methyl-5-thioribose-1-phosphate isomerase [Armatimonadota bacterium]
MSASAIQPIRWDHGSVVLLDQTKLPGEEVYLKCERLEQMAEAICALRVRGAPLIGIAAAYGLALAAQSGDGSVAGRVGDAAETLRATRPTARNLFWAIDRMVARAEAGATAEELLREAEAIHAEDAETCRAIGDHGAALIPEGATVLTICNAGALATGGLGTSLGIIRRAFADGNPLKVMALETRPLLQGAKLTMWELAKDGIPATLLTDGMAAIAMRKGLVDVVITGADRIARDGDTANKIGTYSLAVLARHHGLPFYVAAPMSTVDLSLAAGAEIPIEERAPGEVTCFAGVATAPAEAHVWNPAFDVTPAELITAIVTEKGVLKPPYQRALTT